MNAYPLRNNIEFDLYYDPIEQAILSDWLGLERAEHLQRIDLNKSLKSPARTPGSVRLMPDDEGHFTQYALSNAVARLCLAQHAEAGTSYARVDEYGRRRRVRTAYPRRGRIALVPRHLFSVIWGFRDFYPEAYYVTWLPGFARYVLCSSGSMIDIFGYFDLAVAHFPAPKNMRSEVKRQVCRWWSVAEDSEKWTAFCQPGEINQETANAWAAEYWRKEPEQDEVDD